MKNRLSTFRAALFVVAASLCAMLPQGVLAQVAAVQMPQFVAPRAVLDLGNGPLEIKALTGNGAVFTAQGSGLGSGTTTAITLTGTPAANPPCVGCLISGAGITGVTTITAYNGTTGITVNTSQTIAASTPLQWGAACPVSTMANPVQPPAASLMAFVQPGQPFGDYPFQTEARICGYGGTGPGMQVLTFPIGAH